jgi:hypothetical protein
MNAVGLSSAITVFLITVVNLYFPGVGELMSAPIEAGVVALVAFAAGWLKGPDKKNDA